MAQLMAVCLAGQSLPDGSVAKNVDMYVRMLNVTDGVYRQKPHYVSDEKADQ